MLKEIIAVNNDFKTLDRNYDRPWNVDISNNKRFNSTFVNTTISSFTPNYSFKRD